MKKFSIIVEILAALMIFINVGYVTKKVNHFKSNENLIVSLMKIGLGSGIINEVSGSFYGQHYTAVYYMQDNEVVRKFIWK